MLAAIKDWAESSSIQEWGYPCRRKVCPGAFLKAIRGTQNRPCKSRFVIWHFLAENLCSISMHIGENFVRRHHIKYHLMMKI